MTPQNNKKRTTLVYHPKIDHQNSYIFKVDKGFLNQFNSVQEIVIEGEHDDQPHLKIGTSSYKLKGVNVSTTLLVVSDEGTIRQQAAKYLQVVKFQPSFNEIYQELVQISCKNPLKNDISDADQLIQRCGFTQYSVQKWGFISSQQFGKLSKAMDLLKISQNQVQDRFLYLTLDFSVWVIRQIIKIFNEKNNSLSTPLDKQLIKESIPQINKNSILDHILSKYHFSSFNQSHVAFTQKSIFRFILAEMALAKKQYTSFAFQEVIDEMLLVYMPVQSQISVQSMKQSKKKQLQELWSMRYEYFIDAKGQKYIYYNYMMIESEISSRLKMLGGYKNRWKINELKSIFRGIQFTEDGKQRQLQDVLLKKFRKYGEEYEIKFILPK